MNLQATNCESSIYYNLYILFLKELQSLYWTIAFGLANVIFELNCKQVVNDVFNVKFNRREYDKWLYGAIHTR